MNAIEKLARLLRDEFPEASIKVGRPVAENGYWSLSIKFGRAHTIVEWSRTSGFGLSTASDDSFGEGHDEVFDTLPQIHSRLRTLLGTDEESSPLLPILISRLREIVGVTQVELARRLGVKQATISGIERRTDCQISTLRRVVEALGGRFEVYALVAGRRFRIRTSEDTTGTTSPVVGLKGAFHQDNDPYSSPFRHLRQAGTLNMAIAIAQEVSNKKSVIEMV